ncbi:GDP-mannose 4,6-dehydratase [Candidatus Daviesbacteria bacterium]|nr:GDP-mannose 4,6-dehydratase [Candidatus Daviesbacteria bacterium]
MSKKVLITGAGGFIGSHLVERCVQLGFKVKAFVHYNSANRWGWLDNSIHKKEVEVVSGDIRDFDSIYNCLKNCDTVFHLAALTGIPYSYISPLAYIKTNVEGTYNILEASRLRDVKNIVITSTSEVYGSAVYTPIDENHRLFGQSPYSASKIAADQLALSYYLSFGLPVKIARPFNSYGPRQSARSIIPAVLTQILSGAKKIRVGNLNTARDFTYVSDTVEGIVEISKSSQLFGEVTNIGSNSSLKMVDLVKLLSDLIGIKVKTVADPSRIRPDKSEVENLLCNNSKLIRHTSWKPKLNLEEGLTETIKWFKENHHLYKDEIYNI